MPLKLGKFDDFCEALSNMLVGVNNFPMIARDEFITRLQSTPYYETKSEPGKQRFMGFLSAALADGNTMLKGKTYVRALEVAIFNTREREQGDGYKPDFDDCRAVSLWLCHEIIDTEQRQAPQILMKPDVQ